MTDTKPTLDEQIAALVAFKTVVALQWKNEPDVEITLQRLSASIASLQRLKATDAVRVPEEPVRYGEDTNGEFGEWRNGEYVSYHDYDTLRDLLKRTEEKRSKALKVAAMYARRMMDFEDRAEAAERQLAAMLKLGENPSEEMVLSALQLEPRFKDRHWDKNHLTHREIFTTMFAKLVEQSGVKK